MKRYIGVFLSFVLFGMGIQAIVFDNGITLPKEEKNALLSAKYGKEVLKRFELPRASGISIEGSLELLWRVEEEKERISEEIILAGEPLKEAVKLLITFKGITPLTALAFLADVGDIKRFKKQKKRKKGPYRNHTIILINLKKKSFSRARTGK